MDQGPPPTELVNLAGIAKMAQVKRPAVSNWRRRQEDFPAPAGEAAGAVLFKLPEIERWLRDHGKPYTRPSLELRIWNALAAVRDQANTEAALSAAFDLVSAMPTNATDVPDRPLAGSTAEAAFLKLVHHLALVNGPGEVVEALIAVKGRGGRAAWEYMTPPSIVRLLVALAQPITGVVHDPASGMGGLLLAAARSAEPDAVTVVTGQERVQSMQHIAARRLTAHGIKARLEIGDTLADRPHGPVLADIVLADPPWRQAWRRSVDDDRWFAGTPVASDADMAWLQEGINRLSPSGRAFHVSPGGPLFAGGRNGAIRRKLVARGCVHAVIQLAPGIYHPTTAIRSFVWVLGRPRTAPAEVLLIDASQVGHRVGGRTELDEADVAAIATLYRSWAHGRSPEDSSLPHQTVPVATLLADEHCNLTPTVWLPQEQDAEAEMRHLQLTVNQMAGAWTNLLAGDAPSLKIEPLTSDPPRVTVRELIDADMLEMIRSRRLQEVAGTGSTPLITARDLGRDWTAAATKTIDPDRVPYDIDLTHPGDVLVATSGSFRVAVDDMGGAAVTAPVHTLRCRQDQLDPLVLAALLTSTTNRRRDRGTVLLHRDLLDMDLPLLDLASQQQLAERLRALRRLRLRADELVNSTQEAMDSLIDVVATGSYHVTPDEAKGERR